MFHDGEWGTICDDKFDNRDARVLCRMAGYNDGEYSSSYKQRDVRKVDKIWLDDLACNGNENNVDSCGKYNNRWGSHNCQHHEDVGIKCLGKFSEFASLVL